ncbi:MAG: nitrite reductase large subunit NirB [Acidimicrobiales bacterium]|nr:nitrite reductase large subunit NirB [Acidimicrobiales bacterium]
MSSIPTQRGDRTTGSRPTVLVVGNGMVGHRFVEAAIERGLSSTHRIVVVGEERRQAYDRVHLSALFDGFTPADLALAEPNLYDEAGVEAILGETVDRLDTAAHLAVTSSGREITYDACVIATGSAPFVPPIPGTDAAGSFVYRTIDDLEAIRHWAAGCRTGAVVGGGLLGLEAANALRLLGLETTVVEFAPRLMAVQLDDGGGRALLHHVEGLGVSVRTGAAAAAVRTTPDGRVAGLSFSEGEDLDAELVVFAAGIRPRDQIARDSGLEVGERGGVIIDDRCATSAEDVYAIGEVANHAGKVYGLVAPGYAMADVVAARLAGEEAAFTGSDTPTKLKLLGVDVASVGDPQAVGDEVVVSDPRTGTWKKVVVDAAGNVAGAVLVGDVDAYPLLVQAVRGSIPTPDLLSLLQPASGEAGSGPADLPDEAIICSCHNVSCGTIRKAVDDGCETVADVKGCTKAGTGCGSCVSLIGELVDARLIAAGKTVEKRLCPHFELSRPELYEVVRATGIRTFAELVTKHGTGTGCEICKPVAASIFASLGSGYILDGEQAGLQDSNDHFLANIQRDGTYSVVPRVPGGEITPAQLIAIGEVARDFDLYTKITGGQRIDLLGARVEQLPAIWGRLIDAGLESGQAYGKSVRTVKSCVGSVWCRYGVQDSVKLAIDLENRYRGLRAPHKIKLAVSGCARECAEAQSKDVGVIATEKGWNLYVGGNGGARPAHAVLLAEDLSTEELVRSIDRYLMWYVRTADRLERTAVWQRKLPGGIDFVRRVVMQDELGIGAELEADMEAHVGAYRCEWTETLESPERLARFVSFVNTDLPDPSVTHVRVRGQRIPETTR